MTKAEAQRRMRIVGFAGMVRKQFGILDGHLDGRQHLLDPYALPTMRWAGKVQPAGLEACPKVQPLHDRLAAGPAVQNDARARCAPLMRKAWNR